MTTLFHLIMLSTYVAKSKPKLGANCFTFKTKRHCNPKFGQRENSEVTVYIRLER